MRLPDFVVAGVQRAGTTWLYKCLDEHPDVWMAPTKELHFFDKHWDRGVEWYAEHFADAPESAIVGEATPAYVADGDAVARMAKVLPESRFIVILRNPVDRAYSAYWMFREAYQEMTFEEALAKAPDLVDRGQYADQLEDLFAVVPRANVKVLFYDDLRADPAEFVRDVFSFVGADDSFVPSMIDGSYNAVVFPRLQDALRRFRLGWTIGMAKRTGLAGPVRRLHRRTRRGSYAPLDPAVRARVAERFRRSNEELEQMLDRALPW